MGFIVWDSGLSSSIALAEHRRESPINVIHRMTGLIGRSGSRSSQPYSWLAVIAVFLLLANRDLADEPTQTLAPDPAVFEDEDEDGADADRCLPKSGHSLSGLENCGSSTFSCSRRAHLLLAERVALNISSMVMLFTVHGALCHGTPIRSSVRSPARPKCLARCCSVPPVRRIVGLLGICQHNPARPANRAGRGSGGGANQYTLHS